MTISTEKSLLLKITHFFHVKNKEALVFFSSFNELWKHGCLKMIFFYIESVYYHISFSSLSINHSFALTLSLFLSLLRKNNTSEALPSLTYILQRMALATFTTQQADNSHFLQYFTIMDLIQWQMLTPTIFDVFCFLRN